MEISIHSPRMGRDRRWRGRKRQRKGFQSTLPAWGETGGVSRRPPAAFISIHSPRMGRDSHNPPAPIWTGRFQSTLPAWGETSRRCTAASRRSQISIHSPRMGRDVERAIASFAENRFQSTLPAWGETCVGPKSGRKGPYFNPLSPHGERPAAIPPGQARAEISIHSPRMGRDVGA